MQLASVVHCAKISCPWSMQAYKQFWSVWLYALVWCVEEVGVMVLLALHVHHCPGRVHVVSSGLIEVDDAHCVTYVAECGGHGYRVITGVRISL